jgi:hypothetical protein
MPQRFRKAGFMRLTDNSEEWMLKQVQYDVAADIEHLVLTPPTPHKAH